MTVGQNVKITYSYQIDSPSAGKLFTSNAALEPPQVAMDKNDVCRLWVHECSRVFCDRLVDDSEIGWFQAQMKQCVSENFGCDFTEVFADLDAAKNGNIGREELRSLFFCDFANRDDHSKMYKEVKGGNAAIDALTHTVEDYLEDFNGDSKKPMDLVIFLFAVEHLSRICRILKTPGGNALLVGLGGSGRQSMTCLATYMADYNLFQIAISKTYSLLDWREDMKTLMRKGGTEEKQVVFLFSDTQIKEETFVEDINGILNAGEVPNLFPLDERMAICEATRSIEVKEGNHAAKDMGNADLFNQFVARVKVRLHLCLAFSPVGAAFRARLLKFPSLVNCCTIDWFHAWPADALSNVATRFISSADMDDELRQPCVALCQFFHQAVEELSSQFLSEFRRYNYVTPTSFLELLKTFTSCLKSNRGSLTARRQRYVVGLGKLADTAAQVEGMKKELIDLGPVLEVSLAETAALMKQIDERVPAVMALKETVAAEVAVADKSAAAANKIKETCEAALGEAMPLVHGAVKALNTIKPDDLKEIGALGNPPKGVRVVMHAVCIMMSVKPVKIKDPEGGMKKIDDFWGPSQGLLKHKDLIDQLKGYDRDNIDVKIMKKIRKEFSSDPDFTPEMAKKASNAAEGMCRWVLAMEAYDRVAKLVAPMKAELAQAEGEYAEVMVGLNAKKAQLKEVEDEMDDLTSKLEKAVITKKELEEKVEDCKTKLSRASSLITGLGGEKDRWTGTVGELERQLTNTTGDVVIASGVLAYLGVFTPAYRNNTIKSWVQKCHDAAIPCSPVFDLVSILGNPVHVREWNIFGLPRDAFSTENAIMVDTSRRWPLLIDPQGQANNWIRNMESKNDLQVCKLTDKDYLRILETAVQFGQPVLLENVEEELGATIEPLLMKNIFKQGGVMCIKLGDATVEWSDDFKLYITTNMRNPHYLPETAVKVTLINFMITPDGLEDQLVGIVVAQERPDLEKTNSELIVQAAENKKKLQEIEDQILHILSASEGNILDDQTAIVTLQQSKIVSDDIGAKQKVADKTMQEIAATREEYKPLAYDVMLLFFCIADLANVDPMYQYSLAWFVGLFLQSIATSPTADTVVARLKILKDAFTYLLYQSVCRSLFEKDKLTFSFLICIKIMEGEESVPPDELRFLLTGMSSANDDDMPPNAAPDWIQQPMWEEFFRMSSVTAFAGFIEDVSADLDSWRGLYESTTPQMDEFPAAFVDRKMGKFQRLIILRALRPDKLIPAIDLFVIDMLGQRFVEPPAFDLDVSFKEASVNQPLIFVLSPGSDPTDDLYAYAQKKGIEISACSLGQGQGPIAEKAIEGALATGRWVLLQNCHLMPSWMPTLLRIVEEFNPEVIDDNFRLWLTSYPSPKFPVPILQNGVKMTNEPPKGMRANLYRSFNSEPLADPEFYSALDVAEGEDDAEGKFKETLFKKASFALCFFHGLIQERRQFGPLGWNVPYEFNNSDLKISMQQLQIYISECEGSKAPWPAVSYVVGECNYGGRVTDGLDRVTLLAILKIFFCNEALEPGAPLSESGNWTMPTAEGLGYEGYIEYIQSLPTKQLPETFGFHANADISKDGQESRALLATGVTARSGGGGGGGGFDNTIIDVIAQDFCAKLPPDFKPAIMAEKFPVDYNECLNTVLIQETTRYNSLLKVVRASSEDISKATKGLVVMSPALEKVAVAFTNGLVPALWKGKSYPSLKPLGSYFKAFCARLDLFNKWYADGAPTVMWMPGFFFMQSFTTAVKQNYARRMQLAVDELEYKFECMRPRDQWEKPADGYYVEGMFLEGASWDYDDMVLSESKPKVLIFEMPVIWCKPTHLDDFVEGKGKKNDSFLCKYVCDSTCCALCCVLAHVYSTRTNLAASTLSPPSPPLPPPPPPPLPLLLLSTRSDGLLVPSLLRG